mgnify:FL=1
MESAQVWPTRIMYLNNIMITQIRNILLLGVLAVFLTSCGSSVQEIQVTTVEVSKTPLNIQSPEPLKMYDVEWIIVTKDNAMELFEQLKSDGGEYSVFALTDTGYESLQINSTNIRNIIAEQRQIIISYKEYYEAVDKEVEVTE